MILVHRDVCYKFGVLVEARPYASFKAIEEVVKGLNTVVLYVNHC